MKSVSRVAFGVSLALAAGFGLTQVPMPAGARPVGLMPVNDWEDEDHSHDRARRAREAGEILTIVQIYDLARKAVPGRVLEAELEREHGRWIYELKILDPAGRVYELKLDAATGAVLGREEEH
jgi:uncharacterized membrane protein YkoI